MGGIEAWLELALALLLAATLLHAVRLERAIRALRGEREGLDDAIAGFDNGARQAEAGIARLKEAAQRLSGELAQATALKDDLAFLSERGMQVADRLEAAIRASRNLEPSQPGPRPPAARAAGTEPVRSQAERDLLLALQGAR